MEVTLADGRRVVLNAVDVAYYLSDAFAKASAPDGIAGQLGRYTDDTQNLLAFTGAGGWADLPGRYLNAKWFGAKGDGATDDTVALQAAINRAATLKLNLYIPAGWYKFTRLWLIYDATNNPGYPSTDQGRQVIFGDDGRMARAAFTSGLKYGTVLESTHSVGPAINLEATSAIRGIVLRDLALIASNTTWAVSATQISQRAGLVRVGVEQQGSGGGVIWRDSNHTIFDDVWLHGAGKDVSGIGFHVAHPSVSGGVHRIPSLGSSAFNIGLQIGEDTTGAASSFNAVDVGPMEVIDCNTGIIVQGGARGVKLDSPHVETCATRGIWVRGGAQQTTIITPFLNNSTATVADIQLGDSAASGTSREWRRCLILSPTITNVNSRGIYREFANASTLGLTILNPSLAAAAAGIGTGIDLGSGIPRGVAIINPSYTNLGTNRAGDNPEFLVEDGVVTCAQGLIVGTGTSTGTQVTAYYSATAALAFGTIAANTVGVLTMTVTGAAIGDTVEVVPDGTPGTGLVWSGRVSAANTVEVRVGNVTTGGVVTTDRTWRASVFAH